MRRAFARSPAIYEVLDRNISKKRGPRGGKMYICQQCGKSFPRNRYEVDHIDPVVKIGSSAKDMTFDEIVERMDVSPDKLRGLCKDCHAKITQEQNKERVRLRKLKKFVFDPDKFYILEGGILRHGTGLDRLRKDEIKFIEKGYKTIKGANNYLCKHYPDV